MRERTHAVKLVYSIGVQFFTFGTTRRRKITTACARALLKLRKHDHKKKTVFYFKMIFRPERTRNRTTEFDSRKIVYSQFLFEPNKLFNCERATWRGERMNS